MSRFAGVLLLLSLAACQRAPQTLDPNAEAIAKQFFDEVRTGADLDADTHLAHELKNPTTEAQIAGFRSLIPTEPYRSVMLKTWDAKTDGTGTTTRLTEVYDYGDHTLVVHTALFRSPGGTEPVIVGFLPGSDNGGVN
jgi:hypothetical protein